MTERTKEIEKELLELQSFGKKEIPKISNMEEFVELNFNCILSILISIEKIHKEIYLANSSKLLEHSTIEFLVANPNDDCLVFDLIKLTGVINLPDKLTQDCVVKDFTSKYNDILAKINSNGKVQNFTLNGTEVSAFYNLLTMTLKKNQAINCAISSSGKEPNKISISLNLD